MKMFIFNWNPTVSEVEAYLREMHKKLDECRDFLSQKRAAYEKFDRYEIVSEDPYSLRARTLDSREDRYVLQFLREIERKLPSSPGQVHSIQDLHSQWREVHNFWTDSWEALQRAEARADSAEREYNELQSKQSRHSNVLVSPINSSSAMDISRNLSGSFSPSTARDNVSYERSHFPYTGTSGRPLKRKGNKQRTPECIERKFSTEEVSDIDSTGGQDFRSANSSRDFAEKDLEGN